MSEVRLGTLNKVILMGRITHDTELKNTLSGAAVLNFGLAVNRRYQDSGGEWQDDTCFVNIVAWQKLAERVAERAAKGVEVLVEGRLQSRSWEDDSGNKRSTIEVNAQSIQVLRKREEGAGSEGGGGSAPPPGDDDIPF